MYNRDLLYKDLHATEMQCASLEGFECRHLESFKPSQEIQETTMQLAIGRYSIFDREMPADQLATPQEQRVYLEINRLGNYQSGWSHAISYTRLAKLTGISDRQIKALVKSLIDKRWLEKKRRGNLPNTYRIVHHQCAPKDAPRDRDGMPLKCAVPVGNGSPLDETSPPIHWKVCVAWYKAKIESDFITGVIAGFTIEKMRQIIAVTANTAGWIREQWEKLGLAKRLTGKYQTAIYQLYPKPYKERRKRKFENHKGMRCDEKFYYSYSELWRINRTTAEIYTKEQGRWRHASKYELEKANLKIYKDFMDLEQIIIAFQKLRAS